MSAVGSIQFKAKVQVIEGERIKGRGGVKGRGGIKGRGGRDGGDSEPKF